MIICGDCDHSARHGNRGYGYCRHLEPSDQARRLIEEWIRDKPDVAGILAQTLMAIPGMGIPCGCRKRKPVLLLTCIRCKAQDKFPKMGKLTPTEVAAAKGWWQLGDGDRGRCSDCERKLEASNATK